MDKNGLLYCVDEREVRAAIDGHPCGGECWLSEVVPSGPLKAGVVSATDLGDTICVIVASSEAGVRKIAKEAKVDGA